jgi:NodT family efflux transporter outer membrane factor (OMF) lipoprotein
VVPRLLLPLVVLGGCAAHLPQRPAPTLTVPAHWRSPAAADTGAPDLGRAWWSAFGDAELDALVAAALNYNGDLRIARERVRAFRARTAIVRAAQLPVLDAQLQTARARTLNGAAQPFVTNIDQGGFQASYEIDVWGKLAQASAAALASYQAEQGNTDAVALSIAASVADAYLTLRGLDAQLELARATLALRAESRELARRGFAAGYNSRLEQVQAESEYDATAEQVPQLEHAVAEQENALALLAGRNPGTIVRGRPLADLMPPVVPAGLPSDLLRRRPDIYRAERTLLAQDANLLAVRDQMLPSMKMTVAGGVQSVDLRKLVNAPTALWNLALGMSAPLYQGGRLQAQTELAAAQRDEALFAYESTVRKAFAETETGIDAVVRLKLQEQQSRARRGSAAEALRIARSRHRNGYSSYLEELDAQRTLYGAEVGLLQVRTRVLVAAVDLARALGGGWSGDAIGADPHLPGIPATNETGPQ